MAHELLDRFFEALVNGDRSRATELTQQARRQGASPRDMVIDLFWPAHETIDRLYRADQLSTLSYHFATRLLRVLVDRTASQLERSAPLNHTVFAVCGTTEGEEMAAQMAVDLLEAAGFTVSFAGGGLPGDEILARVHETKPSTLLMFASSPGDLPSIRDVIDRLREIKACPDTQIVVGGGVFNRAEGLAEEIGADLWASDPLELVEMLIENPTQRAQQNQRTVGKKRKVKAA